MSRLNSDTMVSAVLETATLDDGTKLQVLRYVDGTYGIAEDSQPLPDLHFKSGGLEECHAEFNRLVSSRKSLLAEPQPLARKRILAVDDEPEITEMIKLYLERFGSYEVQAVSDPAQAMEAARQFHPDVILLDMMMPEPDGSELAAYLREDPQLCRIPIIFVTALASPTHVPFGVDKTRYVTKPINFDELVEQIEQAIG